MPSLITCPACQRRVSRAARRCPACAHPIKKKRAGFLRVILRVLCGLGAVVFSLAGVVAFGAGMIEEAAMCIKAAIVSAVFFGLLFVNRVL